MRAPQAEPAGRPWLAALCVVLTGLCVAPPARAADPLFVFTPEPPPPLLGQPPPPPKPPPNGYLNGPCGLAVDASGRLYVADHYHDAVDVFTPGPSPTYLTQLAGIHQLRHRRCPADHNRYDKL